MDHNRSINELWELTKLIPFDQKLNQLLKELENYENQIGASPIGGYNKWGKDCDNHDEFKELLSEGPAIISNSVFSIHIGKEGIILDHWTKLGYFCEDRNLQAIFKKIIDRLTEHFGSTTLIYAADSAYKTELINCKIYEGEDINSIIEWIKSEDIRISNTISGIKRSTEGRYYETDACYIKRINNNF